MFSVIIPSFNAERYLPECLESLDRQTCRDFETIIIDDGSTDSTAEIADAYCNKVDNAQVYHGKNRGPLLARRKGMELASGEYLVFVDSDDALRVDALELLKCAIENSKADIVSYGYSRSPDFSTSDTQTRLKAGLYDKDRFHLVREYICHGRFNSLWGKAIRSSKIDIETDYGRYRDLMHGEDLFQLLPIVDKCSSLLQLDDTLYYYRCNSSSSTARYRFSQVTNIAIVNKRLRAYAQKWGATCVNAAADGEVKQYLNLIKMVENGAECRREKNTAYAQILGVMKEEGVFDLPKNGVYRLDDRAILAALSSDNVILASGLVKLIEVIKQIRDRLSFIFVGGVSSIQHE